MELHFKPVSKRDANFLRRYYESCDYGLCEYSVGTKLMWRGALNTHWAEAAGCLVVRSGSSGHYSFDYPVPGPEGDVDGALDAIEDWCKRDYVYYREDLQLFAGRRYSGQRNHIKKFRAQWPEAELRRLTAKDAPAIEAFWKDYEAEFFKGDNKMARYELRRAQEMLKMLGKPYFVAGGMFDGEKLIALSLAEKCGETLIIHIEKALYSYTGVYPTLVQEFAGMFGDGCAYLNREDDAGDRGLRTSKLQYGPAFLASKYQVKVQNELMRHVHEIPELKTERLTLTALREEDIPAYNALVLDGERNRWWGYDDVGGLGGPVEERSFYEVA